MASISELLFVGFNSRVVGLHRDTGQVVWSWISPKGSGYVTVLLDGDRLMVSVQGYTYCLNAETGKQLWFNELEGFGVGVASLASVNGSSPTNTIEAADQMAKRRRNDGASGVTAGQ